MFTKKMTSDRIGGLVSIIIGVVAIVESVRMYKFRISFLQGDHVVPGLAGLIIALLGAHLLLFAKEKSFAVTFPDKAVLKKMVLTILLLLAYIVLILITGYMVSTFLIGAALFKIFSDDSLVKCCIFSSILTFSLYMIFIFWLKMSFPEGLLFTF